MIGRCSSACIYQGLVHIEHKYDFVLCCLSFNIVRNQQRSLLSNPAVEIVFQLYEPRNTVEKNKNCRIRLS